MAAEPLVVERVEQPYVAIREQVAMETFPRIADRLPEVVGWLAGHGIAPAAAPFFRYDVIDMRGEMVVEAGVPVAAAISGEGAIYADVLPAGRYVVVTHVGHAPRTARRCHSRPAGVGAGTTPEVGPRRGRRRAAVGLPDRVLQDQPRRGTGHEQVGGGAGVPARRPALTTVDCHW
jgi:hypothetical protein